MRKVSLLVLHVLPYLVSQLKNKFVEINKSKINQMLVGKRDMYEGYEGECLNLKGTAFIIS